MLLDWIMRFALTEVVAPADGTAPADGAPAESGWAPIEGTPATAVQTDCWAMEGLREIYSAG